MSDHHESQSEGVRGRILEAARAPILVAAIALVVAVVLAGAAVRAPDLGRLGASHAFYAEALREEGDIVDLVVDMRAAATDRKSVV